MIIIGRDLNHSIKKQITDQEGRILILEIKIRGLNYVLGSIYAPTSDRQDDQNSFLDNLEGLLLPLDTTNLILGGDYNVAVDPEKDRKGARAPGGFSDLFRLRVKDFMSDFDLGDAWHIHNPRSCQYNFHRGERASRLDLWLMFNHLIDTCMEVKITPMALSDHSLVSV